MAPKPKNLVAKSAKTLAKTDGSHPERSRGISQLVWAGIGQRFFTSFRMTSLLVACLTILWIFLFRIYRDRLSAFGCFDDCFNIVGGYFLLQGKQFYKDFFFNHQPGMAYLSAAIQYISHPQSLYQLILVHREVAMVFAFIMDILLVFRFGWVGFGFAVLYELTKGYLFGERFLAESFSVYPLVYTTGVVWEAIRQKAVRTRDIVVSALATFFVWWMREPYLPLATWLLAWLAIAPHVRKTVLRVGLFLVLVSTIIVFWFGPTEYVSQLVSANTSVALQEARTLAPWMKPVFIALYPFVLLMPWGEVTILRVVETILALLLLSGLGLLWKKEGTRVSWLMVFVWGALALANIRPPTVVGQMYYANFHHVIWYALVIIVSALLIRAVGSLKPLVGRIGALLFIGCIVNAAGAPKSYIYDKIDRTVEFTTNYAFPYVPGVTFRRLAAPGDTMFVDAGDELMYWQAGVPSSYPFGWYTLVMSQIPRFQRMRDDMFLKTPPTFFYGTCVHDVIDPGSLPAGVLEQYVRLTVYGRPSCMFVRKNKLPMISAAQWEDVKGLGVMLQSPYDAQ